jgi:hypothetical protein
MYHSSPRRLAARFRFREDWKFLVDFLWLPIAAVVANLTSMGLYLHFYAHLCNTGHAKLSVEAAGLVLSNCSLYLLWSSFWYLATGEACAFPGSVRFFLSEKRLNAFLLALCVLSSVLAFNDILRGENKGCRNSGQNAHQMARFCGHRCYQKSCANT